MFILRLCGVIFMLSCKSCVSERSFKIDYENDQFLMDGEPFHYISGSVHYFRVPRIYWSDSLLKLKAAGLNVVQTYTPWSLHQPMPHEARFSGNLNVTEFVQIAHSLGLYVILRPGPYSCAELDHGGMPWWLYKNHTLGTVTRTTDPGYIGYVKKWFDVLLPMFQPLLYKNGGPIIMFQVENEYGLYGLYQQCDVNYMKYLRDLMRNAFGDDVVLFSVDPVKAMHNCSLVAGIYPTLDFGPGSVSQIPEWFRLQRSLAPRGPLVNSEFYPAYFQHWGAPNWPIEESETTRDWIATMYRLNASFNLYMFLGGTNFGHLPAGVDYLADRFSAVTTNYVFDSPLTENGDTTKKFRMIRKLIPKLTGKPITIPVPRNRTKIAYGKFQVKKIPPSVLYHCLPSVQSRYPKSFEDLNNPFGIVVYEAALPADGTEINIPGIADTGYVAVNAEAIGVVNRKQNTTIQHKFKANQTLSILVDSLGRTDSQELQLKGITANVTIDKKQLQPLQNWTMYLLEPILIAASKRYIGSWSSRRAGECDVGGSIRSQQYSALPAAFSGSFSTPVLADTFFDATGWGRGYLYINENLIGRYWPLMGPQMSLYVPKSMLKPMNKIILFELEHANCNASSCSVTFTDKI